MLKDVISDIGLVLAEPPVRQTNSDTALVSEIIDTSQYMGGFFAIMTGALTDADMTSTVLLEESDNSDMSSQSSVADADLLPSGTGQEASAAPAYTSDNVVTTLGYVGAKRYIRLTLTPSGNGAGNLDIAILWIGLKRKRGETTGS